MGKSAVLGRAAIRTLSSMAECDRIIGIAVFVFPVPGGP
jgi:hypothetical protein